MHHFQFSTRYAQLMKPARDTPPARRYTVNSSAPVSIQ
ncbi:hypothetical protein Pvag_pPag10075 (plasmid) [Pantoea vagans C9-1]|nr:hypothetical protein Pvag_pPag10075 [Pantoea vagans C9-1]